jgi:hypothetical protein
VETAIRDGDRRSLVLTINAWGAGEMSRISRTSKTELWALVTLNWSPMATFWSAFRAILLNLRNKKQRPDIYRPAIHAALATPTILRESHGKTMTVIRRKMAKFAHQLYGKKIWSPANGQLFITRDEKLTSNTDFHWKFYNKIFTRIWQL